MIKKQIKAGETNIMEALLEPDCATMKAFELWQAQVGWRGRRTRRLFVRAGIGEGVRCGDLTTRQLQKLNEAA